MIKELYIKLSNEFGVTEEEFSILAKVLKTRQYKKGDFILKQEEIDSQVKFVISGIVHQYIMVEEENHTIDITLSNMFFNCYKSYVEGSLSFEIQEAISDVQLVYIEREDAETLFKECNWFCYMYMKAQEKIHLERENRSFILQHKDVLKRLKLFMELNDNADRYYQEVTDKLIAKYLAMTPESFSKVKKAYFRL